MRPTLFLILLTVSMGRNFMLRGVLETGRTHHFPHHAARGRPLVFQFTAAPL